jgi:hypothetical protein
MNSFKVKKIVVSVVLAVCLIMTTAYAAFPDVAQDKYGWAVEAINSMADKGIIKGYEDGTFNPEKSISKLEGLALVSRILGCNDAENESFSQEAVDKYEETLAPFELAFGEKEVSYLVAKGVIKESELEDYIGKSNYNNALKRYEIAILLTKALDGEEGLSASANLQYSDAAEIPASAKKYVEFVTAQNLMNGMDENKFSPNTNVTRAQAAVVLQKLQSKTGYEFKSGTVVEMNTVTSVIKIKDLQGQTYSHTLLPGVIYRYNGERITISEINVGYVASVTYKDGSVYAIDFTPSNADEVLYGVLTSVSTSAANPSISIAPLAEDATEPSKEKKTYKVSGDAAITYNGDSVGLAALKVNSYVKINVKSGNVRAIAASDKTTTSSGIVSAIYYDPIFRVAVEDKNGDVKEYLFKDSATITRNGKNCDATDLTQGDVVVLTLEYDRIAKMTATSKNTTATGTISAILISANPKLTIRIDGEDITYPISATAEYAIAGSTTNSIYDLRTNSVVTVNVESNTITKVVSSFETESKIFTGSVISVTPAANVFQVTHADPATGVVEANTVIVNSKTTIIDVNGKAKKLSDLLVNNQVTVYGTIGSGVISATTVMIIN